MSELLKTHFMNPKNIGSIKKAKYTAKNKSGFCGDTIETYLNIKDGIIIDAKYQACGCWALIGSASIFSEFLKDKTCDEILTQSDEDYLNLLGDVPEEKLNCVQVSRNGFLMAIQSNI